MFSVSGNSWNINMTDFYPAKTVCLVRPLHFGFNHETAASNIFQVSEDPGVSKTAAGEFAALAATLEKAGIDCILVDDRKEVVAPDAVFPNNWFSTHADGIVVLYPLLSPLRRAERRADLFDTVLPNAGFHARRILDFTSFEARGMYLEGTGSLVFDHRSKMAYACLSSRTERQLAELVCRQLGYEIFCFEATANGKEIYHTNVMLSIGSAYAILCGDCITSARVRNDLFAKLPATGRDLIDISLDQLYAFAGNVLELQNRDGNFITVISSTAMKSLRPEQVSLLEKNTTLLEASIPVIEKTGGGSVRCMMAEIFLMKKNSW